MMPGYRADIDGLRAVAVLSIVLYHLGIEPFSGGFVGVDIFFVISGFLITSIILRKLAAGEFSLAGFYERRVRRILPALIVVLVATLVAGRWLLAPQPFAELAGSAAATTVFSSNVFFFLGSGYFAGASEYKPLLHTWSLAVEEQYYILFPFLLMWIASKAKQRFLPWLLAMAGLSLAGSIVVTRIDEAAAFFLIPFRAWELLIGSLLAVKVLPAIEGQRLQNSLAAVGFAMIATSVFAFSSETPFPGIAAALPTLGTALVIHAGKNGSPQVNRLLGIRPLVFFGLISYSLYLWHWPIIVFAKTVLINEPGDMELSAIAAVTLLLSTLSWRFVEKPFRRRDRLQSRGRLFAAFGGVSLVLLCVSLGARLIDSFSPPSQPDTLVAQAIDDPGWKYWKACEERAEESNDDPDLCRFGADNAGGRVLFWGDSHALALASATHLSARRHDAGGWLAVRSACPPLRHIERPGRQSCADFNEAVLRWLEANDDVDTVLLAARWALSANGARYKDEAGSPVSLVDLNGGGQADGASLVALGLHRTVKALRDRGKRVVLVTQVPEIGYDVPRANYSAKLTGRNVSEMIAPSRSDYEERSGTTTSVILSLAEELGAGVIDPSSLLCDHQRCNVVMDGTPLYRDDNHLSLRGCVLLSPLFDSLFASPTAEN